MLGGIAGTLAGARLARVGVDPRRAQGAHAPARQPALRAGECRAAARAPRSRRFPRSASGLMALVAAHVRAHRPARSLATLARRKRAEPFHHQRAAGPARTGARLSSRRNGLARRRSIRWCARACSIATARPSARRTTPTIRACNAAPNASSTCPSAATAPTTIACRPARSGAIACRRRRVVGRAEVRRFARLEVGDRITFDIAGRP
jgi:hypothetical protein